MLKTCAYNYDAKIAPNTVFIEQKYTKQLKEAIKTPLGITILVTVVVVIFLIVLTIIKDTFLGGETIDYSILFLALVPFLIYLAVSGKISEIGGGGFWIKINKASEAKVFWESKYIILLGGSGRRRQQIEK